jgi:sugar phosphate isomerase/epimerase
VQSCTISGIEFSGFAAQIGVPGIAAHVGFIPEDVVGQHVVSVHCKDGDWPPPEVPGALGTERPLGQGSVDLNAFLAGLKKIGYKGPLTIEREAEDKEERLRDLGEGRKLLEELRTKNLV